ncbi:uncharacterized protein LOC111823706 [Myotis lucifugus]|uniref:uncharacterized protein LOC111823706 n=1 Tax=Myotis lucifugus TaxID=59463 RepID=UPI000CCC26FF|nr:uncharacterized protein LOC111823706 [Myotis lucifugus]
MSMPKAITEPRPRSSWPAGLWGGFSGGRPWLGTQIWKQRLTVQGWVTVWGWGGVDGILRREQGRPLGTQCSQETAVPVVNPGSSPPINFLILDCVAPVLHRPLPRLCGDLLCVGTVQQEAQPASLGADTVLHCADEHPEIFLTRYPPTSLCTISRFLKSCQEIGFGVTIPCSECPVGNAVLKYISRPEALQPVSHRSESPCIASADDPRRKHLAGPWEKLAFLSCSGHESIPRKKTALAPKDCGRFTSNTARPEWPD